MSILGINQKLNFDNILECEKNTGKIHEEFVAENLKTTLSCLTPLGSLMFINNYAQSVLTKYAIIADSLGLLKTEEQVKILKEKLSITMKPAATFCFSQ